MTGGDRDRVILAEVIARCWQDPAFKEEFLKDPRTHLNAAGMDIPEGVKVEVLQNTPEVTYVGVSQQAHPETYKAVGGTLFVPRHEHLSIDGDSVTRRETQFGATISERFSVDDQGRPHMDRTGPGPNDGWSITANPDGSTDDKHMVRDQVGQVFLESRHGEAAPAEEHDVSVARPYQVGSRPWALDSFRPDYRPGVAQN